MGVKEEIIDKKSKKIKENAVTVLRDAYSKGKTIKIIQNSTELNLLKEYNETAFKCWRSWRKGSKYYYFVSDIGRVVFLEVKPDKQNKLEKFNTGDECNVFDIEKYNCWIFPQSHDTLCLDVKSFLITNDIHNGCRFNSSTPVYTMVGETWLSEQYLQVSQQYEDERIELHHIDGNNMNLNIDNLVYLPNHIHAVVHTTNC